MTLWTDLAAWRGPTVNQSGRMVEQRGVVVHIAEGTFEGTIAWQKNPAADVSSHFVVDFDGAIAQVVDTDIAAWTQAAGNGHWLSIENAGFHTGQLTPAQVEANAQILARAHREYGVPLQLAGSPSGYGLGWHGMGGAAWGNHPNCPGPNNVALLPQIVARANEIVNGGGWLMALTDEQQADLYRRVCNLDSAMYYAELQGGQIPAGQFALGYGVGEPTDAPLPYRLVDMVAALLARPPAQVDAAAVAAALVADPAFKAALDAAAFQGAQRAEDE